jgi:hypothetical protein
MQDDWTHQDAIASAVMAAIGVAFLAWAIVSVDLSTVSKTFWLWLLAGALGTVSSALAPQSLFRRFLLITPENTGLNLAAMICFFLAALFTLLALVLWLVGLVNVGAFAF